METNQKRNGPLFKRKRSIDDTKSENLLNDRNSWSETYRMQIEQQQQLQQAYQQQQQNNSFESVQIHEQLGHPKPNLMNVNNPLNPLNNSTTSVVNNPNESRERASLPTFQSNNYYPYYSSYDSFNMTNQGSSDPFPFSSNKTTGKMAQQSTPQNFYTMDSNASNIFLPSNLGNPNMNSNMNSNMNVKPDYVVYSPSGESSEEQQNANTNLNYLAMASNSLFQFANNPQNNPQIPYTRNFQFELPPPNLEAMATKQLMGMRNGPPTLKRQTSTSLLITDGSDVQPPVTVFRNLFHTIYINIQNYDTNLMDGSRVYIDDRVGYSGNATRFKKVPDAEEKAYVLNISILDPNRNPVSQCKTCKEYYDHQKYFKSSPDALGKTVLVKNNSPTRIDKDTFKVAMKVMCACTHHNVEYFQCIVTLRKQGESQPSHSSSINIYCKQWRKSNQKKEDLTLNLFPIEAETSIQPPSLPLQQFHSVTYNVQNPFPNHNQNQIEMNPMVNQNYSSFHLPLSKIQMNDGNNPVTTLAENSA